MARRYGEAPPSIDAVCLVTAANKLGGGGAAYVPVASRSRIAQHVCARLENTCDRQLQMASSIEKAWGSSMYGDGRRKRALPGM